MSSSDGAPSGGATQAARAPAGHGYFWDYDPWKLFPEEDRCLYATVTRDEDLARRIEALPFQEEGLFLIDGWLDHDTELAVRTTLEDQYGKGQFERYLICTDNQAA